MTADEAIRLIQHNRWVISPTVEGGWTIDTQSGRELARTQSNDLIEAVGAAIRTLAFSHR